MQQFFLTLAITSQAAILFAAQNESSDLKVAKEICTLASQGEFPKLKILAKSSPSPTTRLFAGYVLYQSNKKSNARIFANVFPSTHQGALDFIKIYQSIPYSAKEEGNEYRHNNLKWTLGFWSIYHAYLELVKSDNNVALKRFLLLAGLGDGEVGEGISEDIANLFYDPKFVLSNWSVLAPHKEFLRSVKNYTTPGQFSTIRNGYESALQPSDPRKTIILRLLDNPE